MRYLGWRISVLIRGLKRKSHTSRSSMATAVHVRAAEPRETETYRLIVFNRAGTAVLLDTQALRYELLLVNIPKFTRPAQEITTLLRDRLQMLSVLLFSGVLEQTPNTIYFA